MFDDVYRGKRVLVTGNTGFKGSWLTTWLLKLGAKVIGVSKDVPTQPAMFEEIQLAGRIDHFKADIRDLTVLQKLVKESKPDFVFHLAAQAIVSKSYLDPLETISTNVIGTTNMLEALRHQTQATTAVFITSDKCYDNVEWPWGYRETDALGGKDIYSGSKGSAELVIKSYTHSFFNSDHPVRIAVGRAGNVIGGGDWADDRIVVDCVRAWSAGRRVEVRMPRATRPWQHVLEPLSGYLLLGQALKADPTIHGEAFNFGPRAEQSRTVIELLQDLAQHWGFENPSDAFEMRGDKPFHEAGLLKLNCDKALLQLHWQQTLAYTEAVRMVGEWYGAYYRRQPDMFALTTNQIESYEQRASDLTRQRPT